MKPIRIIILGCFAWTTFQSHADSSSVQWGGFVDSYYAFDFSNPGDLDRQYTTQPARHNEFNINLAYIDVVANREKMRGRLALQAGTSVQSNYSGEPGRGSVSGPLLSRHLQEAYAGYKINKKTVVDAGIFFSHIGMESFISRDNPIYTRSLVGDYSPYYFSGARVTSDLSPEWTVMGSVLNGWQNISETNGSKAFGGKIDYKPSGRWNWTYANFIGNENGFRHFHEFVVKFIPSSNWYFMSQFDLGWQDRGNTVRRWGGFSIISRYALSSTLALAHRVESYRDPHSVIVNTVSGRPFEVWGMSLGLDSQLTENLVWRSELRGFSGSQPVFQGKRGISAQNGMWVTSLSATF